MRRFISVLLTLVLLAACCAFPVSAGAADKGDTEELKITGSKVVAVGKTVTLTANKKVTWKSSNKKIATVNKKGAVKGIKAGTVKITAETKDGSKLVWKMTVKAKAVKSIKITGKTDTLDLQGTRTVQLKAKASPSGAAQSFEWRSSNKKVATVSASGKVTAKSAGEVTITAFALDGSKKKATYGITVKSGGSNPELPDGKYDVGIFMPTNELQRWEKDGKNLEAKLKAAGYSVILQYAGNDISMQISQIDAVLDQGCKVMIIGAIEGGSLGTVLDKAKTMGTQVIAYDRLLLDTDAVSYYITFSNYKVGTLQGNYIKKKLSLDSESGPFYIEFTAGDPGDNNAYLFYAGAMDVLRPYLEAGILVAKSGQTAFENVATPVWKTDTAQLRAESILAMYYDNGPDLDAWLCSNDSTALGVTNALEANYIGSWPVVTGQDCDVQNVKNIIAGIQAMSVFKDTTVMVKQAAKMAGQILKGEEVDINDETTYNNNVMVVPAYLCSPMVIDKSNVHYLVECGYYDEDQLY